MQVFTGNQGAHGTGSGKGRERTMIGEGGLLVRSLVLESMDRLGLQT